MKFLLQKFFFLPPKGVIPLNTLLTIMRYTTVTLTVLLVCCNMLLASISKGQTIKDVSIIARKAMSMTLKQALKQIEKQTDFRLAYKDEQLKPYSNVILTNGKYTVEQALLQILGGTDLMYKQRNNYILIVPKPQTQQPAPEQQQYLAANITIKGKVTDKATGEPLIGVSIRIKGARDGVATDVNGLFSLSAPENATVVVTYIGYATQEIAVNNQATINIALEPSSKGLNEVVVVGYGTQKKINLTGSIATVNADKIENRPVVNLGDALEGLIPNLNVSLNGGQPGTGATYNIRGTTTLGTSTSSGTAKPLPTSTTPLILVDGVARDANLIDPNDVASVTVLKDVASAAIYGGRAANGVILITTKTGKAGQTRVSYSGSYTISRPTQLVDQVNSLQYIKMFNDANRTGLASGGYTTSPFTEQDSTMAVAYFNDPAHNPTGYPDPGNPKKYRYVGNTDWNKVLFPGWAPQQQHNISVSGGQGNSNFLASMGYFRQDGLQKSANQVYQRYTPTLKLNTDLAKWISLGLNMSLTHTDNNQPASTRISQGGAWLYSNIPPVMPVYNPDGNGHFAGQGNYTNPLAVNALSGRDIDQQNDFWTTGRLILKPVDHLIVNVDYTWNNLSDFRKANLIPFNEYGVNGTFLDVYPWTNPSQVIENKTNNNYNALNAFATYENTFGKKHYIKALVGYNQEYQHYVLGSSFANNLIDPTVPSIGLNNSSKPIVAGLETEYALVGTFSRLNYIYDNKYLLEVNARYDGTSRFQPDNRYSFSPSASAGWNISEESFMEGIKGTLNQLKLRASYGQLPNQLAPGNGATGQILNMLGPSLASANSQYPYIAVQPTGLANYLINGQQGVYAAAPGLISQSFTWEKVQTKNIGLDYSLFNDKLNGSFDYFITNIKDILVPGQQAPSTLGAPIPPSNSANVRSHGWEFSINWRDKLFDDQLNYSMTLGVSNSSNTRVIKYNGNPTNSINDFIVGHDLGDIYGFVNDGFYKTDAEAAAVDNSALAGYKWLAGDIKYRDLNNDGKITYGDNTLGNLGDKKLIGNSTPHYKFGFNLNLSYKNFDFATFIQGVLKQDFYPNEYVFYAFRDDEYSIPSQLSTNYWTPTNTNAFFPRIRFAGGGNEQSQDKYILNAAYARIKQLTLGYSLSSALAKKIKLQKIRLYVTGQNLFTITSLNKNYDPETATTFGAYPLNKSLSFGLQATF